MMLERVKLGKLGLGTLLLGNSDASYDDFGIRKIIVIATSHGGLYGLDSKSGKVLWQNVFPAVFENGEENGIENVPYLFLQRTAMHYGLEPVMTLVRFYK
jgi:hypothetical protein